MRAQVVEVGAFSAACNPTSQGVLFVHVETDLMVELRSTVTDWLARRYRRQGRR